ncbi:MAG: class I SAM-dependent methyltransferase [Gammaproteobacteria bacterium]|nr:MAG: class I SAM-dependent methyltransferase [Gammaproteobacteria bacterium]
MSINTLLNMDFITSMLTVDDPWCSSHGSDNGSENLSAGMLYYALAYSTRAHICVCLGSGGGFVPRLMRQAQRDLNVEGGRTFLVDGAQNVSRERKDIWGSPYWIDEDSTFRNNYPDIEIVLKLTEDAFNEVFLPNNISIDYLHIDADHHYDGAKRDWDLYRTLVSDNGVITLHDTTNYREPCGVPQLVDEIRESGEYDIVNFPLAYGTAIAKKILTVDENIAASRASRSSTPGQWKQG